MDRQALVAQLLTGQDQMFGFPADALDAARPLLAPHRDEGEGLPADAQVVLVHHPPLVGAHGLHSGLAAFGQERLCGSATPPVVLDVNLPLVVVQRRWGTRAQVASEERVEAVVPLGELAGSVILSRCLMTD